MEKLNDLLNKLGLSSKQAKVYAALLQHECKTATQISEVTKIHPQDVYKILNVLKEKGLVAVTFGKPIKIGVYSVEPSLNAFLEAKKTQFLKHNDELEGVVREIGRTISHRAVVPLPESFEETFVFQMHKAGSTSLAIRSKAVNSFVNARIHYDVIIPYEMLFETDDDAETESALALWQILAQNKVKARILVGIEQNQKVLVKRLRKLLPKNLFYEIRTKEELPDNLTFAMVDSKELWVNMVVDSTMEVTSCKTIITMANMVFDQLWASSEVFTINKPAIEKNA